MISASTVTNVVASLPNEQARWIQVTLVGLVSNKDEKVTDVVFMLDDGTGRIEVKRWYWTFSF